MKRHALTIALALMLPACAGEQEMRSASSQSGAILSQYRAEFVRFSAAQNQLNAANSARLLSFERERQFRANEIQSRTRAWRLAEDRQALARFEMLTAGDAVSILTATDATSVAPQPTEELRFEAAPVEGLIRQLGALQQPRSAVDRAFDLVNFASRLRTAYDATVAAASQTSSETATSTAAQTASAIAQPN